MTKYYELAPKIVAAIEASTSANDYYTEIYEKMIVPCVSHIEKEEYSAAYELYKKTVDDLKKQLL